MFFKRILIVQKLAVMGERKEVWKINHFQIQCSAESGSAQVYLLINDATAKEDWKKLEDCYIPAATRIKYWDYGGDKSTDSGWGKFGYNTVWDYVQKGKSSGHFQPVPTAGSTNLLMEPSEEDGSGKAKRGLRHKRKQATTPEKQPEEEEKEGLTALSDKPSASPASKKAKAQQPVRIMQVCMHSITVYSNA